jgi:hypothetical protein
MRTRDCGPLKRHNSCVQEATNYIRGLNTLTSGKTLVEVLKCARALLDNEEHWAQGARARDERGRNVRPEDPSAVKWCLEGACARVSNNYGITPPDLLALFEQIVRDDYGIEDGNGSWWNDNRDHESMLRLLDDAVARLTG